MEVVLGLQRKGPRCLASCGFVDESVLGDAILASRSIKNARTTTIDRDFIALDEISSINIELNIEGASGVASKRIKRQNIIVSVYSFMFAFLA